MKKIVTLFLCCFISLAGLHAQQAADTYVDITFSVAQLQYENTSPRLVYGLGIQERFTLDDGLDLQNLSLISDYRFGKNYVAIPAGALIGVPLMLGGVIAGELPGVIIAYLGNVLCTDGIAYHVPIGRYLELQAHVAPLGLTYFKDEAFAKKIHFSGRAGGRLAFMIPLSDTGPYLYSAAEFDGRTLYGKGYGYMLGGTIGLRF